MPKETTSRNRIPSFKEQKQQLANTNTLITRPIPRIDNGIIKETKARLKGRAKRYTPMKMKNGINRYFEWCEKEDEMPSIKGMMIHMNMYKDQFYAYLKYPEFTDIMEHARMIISNWAENDVYNTKGMAAGKIAYMKNVHGWSDKIETNNTTTQTVITVDQAKAKIEMLAPKLLEVLNNHTTLMQITKRPNEKVVEAEVEEEKA